MNSGKYVFAQVLQYVNKYEFGKCVKRCNGDHRTRDFNCWNQFVQLFFGQLTAAPAKLCLVAYRVRKNTSHIR
ncbi:DUF4372 domain-containing protein [Flavivirga sp. 57AJ16]|uniref:DUF4372 domain-containing protein n=1 Tax=Flavivirga sp. 57AJ16 TaxID=3025307 RepID=UPI00236662E9|nr:DUF4372 domain-containing protein [Flavivirga sp. 57AJ16]MDD7884752.1 DUF4372 domain-containing protein [Flavivirga sp. 57AJ16]